MITLPPICMVVSDEGLGSLSKVHGLLFLSSPFLFWTWITSKICTKAIFGVSCHLEGQKGMFFKLHLLQLPIRYSYTWNTKSTFFVQTQDFFICVKMCSEVAHLPLDPCHMHKNVIFHEKQQYWSANDCMHLSRRVSICVIQGNLYCKFFKFLTNHGLSFSRDLFPVWTLGCVSLKFRKQYLCR